MGRWESERSWPQQRAEGFRSSRALGVILWVTFVVWFIIGLAVIAGWGAL